VPGSVRERVAPLLPVRPPRRHRGPAHTLQAVTRLRGGSKKGVYRLVLDNGTTAILYVWGGFEDS
jgi:hypothetical protein